MDLESEKNLTKKLLKRLRPDWHELRYDEILNKPYLIGKEKKSEKTKTLYLLRRHKKITFKDLKNVIANTNQSSITLAIHSDDSTHLFYKCQMGLKTPLSNAKATKKAEEAATESKAEEAATESKAEEAATESKAEEAATESSSDSEI